jgi:hypothetical protein
MSLVEASRPSPQQQYQQHQRQQVVRNLQSGKRVEVELSEHLCNDIRAAFNLFDTRQSGKVQVSNLGTVRGGASTALVAVQSSITLTMPPCCPRASPSSPGCCSLCLFASTTIRLRAACLADLAVLRLAAHRGAAATPSLRVGGKRGHSRTSDFGGGSVPGQACSQGGNPESVRARVRACVRARACERACVRVHVPA